MVVHRLLFLLLSMVVLGLNAGFAEGQSSDDVPLKVVATYSILGDIVKNVAGEQINLIVLVGRDGDPHVYEPTPQDAIALAGADLIFENGLMFEAWLDELYEASGSTARRVVVSKGVDVIDFAGHDDDHDDDHDHDDHDDDHHRHNHDNHEHGEFDPHIWHDPHNGIVIVENIRDALAEIDPNHAEMYQANAEAYMAELTALDVYIAELVEEIPAENRVLVTSHESFGYFAHRYGFEMITALGAFSTDVSDPSAGQIAALVKEVRAFGVPAIFGENITTAGLLEQLARETGVNFIETLYTDALGQVGTDGDSYLNLLRYNAETIAEALK